MNFRSFLVVLTFLLSAVVYADAPKIWLGNDGGLWGHGSDYLSNGKTKVSHGIFGSYDLKDLVADNPTALELNERQLRFNTYAHLSYWFGVIPSAFGLGFGLSNSNPSLGIISAVTFIGTALLTGHFISVSRHEMFEAINLYNGVKKASEIDSQTSSSLGRFEQLSATGYLSSAVAFSFNF